MMTEVTYREYEDDGQYKWAKSLLYKLLLSEKFAIIKP